MKGRGGGLGRIPVSHKGKLIKCDICGFWYGEREGKLLKQRGMWVCREDYDTLTDKQRQDSIKKS